MDRIAAAVERLDDLVAHRPGFGTGTASATSELTNGLACRTTEAAWVTMTDLPRAFGGGATAPTPSALIRAALGSCMVMSYRLRAARHGVAFDSVRITVETDSELSGLLACDAGPPPGFTGVRYHVEVESPSASEDIERVIDEGDRLSPVLDVFTRATAAERTLSIQRRRA